MTEGDSMQNEQNDHKMDGKSLDIVESNKAVLKELFPEVFSEGKIDFEKLRLILGDDVETSNERYNFTWNGKEQAIRISQTPSMGTLRPCKEESVDWDTTKNLYIEGDNLEVLKLLQKSYYGKIKMIYIDPPYNTGKDFVYADDYQDNIANYKRITGQVDEGGRSLSTNMDTGGRYHTNWLNMMYPRLKLARHLLSESGVILINIDENEIINLHKICDEIYGEQNNLGMIVWDKRNPKGDAKGVACQNEFILLYAKNREVLLENCEIVRPKKNASAMISKAKELFEKISPGYSLDDANTEYRSWLKQQDGFSGGEKAYDKIDEDGNVFRPVSMAWPNKKKAPDDYFIPLIHPITNKPCSVPERGWRNPPSTMTKLLNDGLILFGKDETTIPNCKYLLKDNMYENIPSLLYNGGSDTRLLEELDIPFDTPKMVSICREHIQTFTKNDDIILDFFSGSCTIAHAVMESNSMDNASRRFIMVQIPEPCSEESIALKKGFNNICEIGKARIIRSGNLVSANRVQRTLDSICNVTFDKGFRVFKLDTSNISVWNPGIDLRNSLLKFENNLKIDDRADLDVVYEILLKKGLDLNSSVDLIDGSKFYSIASGALMVCLEDVHDTSVAEMMVELYKELQPMVWSVVFKDNGFLSDDVKANTRETLRMAGLQDGMFETL